MSIQHKIHPVYNMLVLSLVIQNKLIQLWGLILTLSDIPVRPLKIVTWVSSIRECCNLYPESRVVSLCTTSNAWSTADSTPEVFKEGALLTISAKYSGSLTAGSPLTAWCTTEMSMQVIHNRTFSKAKPIFAVIILSSIIVTLKVAQANFTVGYLNARRFIPCREACILGLREATSC